jgi:hypothetical protein
MGLFKKRSAPTPSQDADYYFLQDRNFTRARKEEAARDAKYKSQKFREMRTNVGKYNRDLEVHHAINKYLQDKRNHESDKERLRGRVDFPSYSGDYKEEVAPLALSDFYRRKKEYGKSADVLLDLAKKVSKAAHIITDERGKRHLDFSQATILEKTAKAILSRAYRLSNCEGIPAYQDNLLTEVIRDFRDAGLFPHSALESATIKAASIAGIFGGLFFLSTNMPNASMQFSPGAGGFNWAGWFGVILVLIGIISGWFWFKNNKEIKKVEEKIKKKKR